MGGYRSLNYLSLEARVNGISEAVLRFGMGVEVRHHQQPHIPSSSETSRSISHRVVETVLKAHRLHLAAKLYALRFGVLTLGG